MNKTVIIVTILLVLLLLFWIFKSAKPPIPSHSDNLYTHLKFVDNVLTDAGIKHWVMYGSLLGGVREKNIIEYDHDFDFGAEVKNAAKIEELNKKINQYGYKFYKAQSQIGNGNPFWRVSYKISYNDEIFGDIYLYHKCADGFMRRYSPEYQIYFYPQCTFPAWFVDELSTVTIRDKQFPCPRDPIALVQHWYGKTWNTPIKAKSCGGQGSVDHDYYGNDKNLKLQPLIDYLNKYNIYLKPDVSNLKVKILFPPSQKEWMINNEQ